MRLFISVFLISFTGSLPPGTLNTGVTSLVVSRGAGAAILFGAGGILVELIIVWLALLSIGYMRKWFNIVGCVVILLLAVASFKIKDAFSVLPDPFPAGVILSILNPLHYPFWLGWALILRSRKMMDRSLAHRRLFVIAAGVGTVSAFLGYGIAGSFVAHYFQDHRLINVLVGSSLLVAGLLQLGKLIRRPRTVSRSPDQ